MARQLESSRQSAQQSAIVELTKQVQCVNRSSRRQVPSTKRHLSLTYLPSSLLSVSLPRSVFLQLPPSLPAAFECVRCAASFNQLVCWIENRNVISALSAFFLINIKYFFVLVISKTATPTQATRSLLFVPHFGGVIKKDTLHANACDGNVI